MLLGEVGGLYGALVGFPAIFLSYYAQYAFMSAVISTMPQKKKEKESSRYEQSGSGLKGRLFR